MATVDTSIYSRVSQGGQLSDLVNSYAKGRLAHGQMRKQEAELDALQKEQAKKLKLSDLTKQHYKGGRLDRVGFTQGLVDSGYGAEIPAYEKQWGEADKASAEGRIKQLEAGKKQIDFFHQQMGSLLAQPEITDQALAQAMVAAVRAGYITPEEGAEHMRTLPPDQASRRALLQQNLIATMDASKQLEALLPKVQAQNLGGHTQMVDTNPLTNPGIVGQSLEHTATPGEIEQQRHNRASEGLTARGQNMTDARARETKNAASLKPMPAAALKMIQTSTDAIGTAASINADLGAIAQQITSGKLSFGPISNLVNAARNATGTSTEESRNFASFKASLEKLRNDSLRLNAGVQTDGDAQRAWNELFQNITDTKLVEQRLQEIMRINQRAVQLRQLDIDSVLQNYGRDPMDTSGYANQPAALSSGSAQKPASNQSQVNPSQGPVAIKTDADYNNLPSGTRFKAPDGSIRVKP